MTPPPSQGPPGGPLGSPSDPGERFVGPSLGPWPQICLSSLYQNTENGPNELPPPLNHNLNKKVCSKGSLQKIPLVSENQKLVFFHGRR